MRIAILTNEYPPHVYGGAGVHVEYLSRELANLDGGRHTVKVLCFGDQEQQAASPTVKGISPPCEIPSQDPRHQKVMDTLLRNVTMSGALVDVDIIHCHTWYTHMAGCLLRQLLAVPLVLTTHSLEPHRPWKEEQLGAAYHVSSWVEKTAYQNADGVVAVSPAMQEDVHRLYGVPHDRIHVIPNGIDTEQYRPTPDSDLLASYQVDPNRPTVLFVGRISRQKGILHLINAIPYLEPDVQVVLCAGMADTEELAAEMARKVEAARRETPNPIIWIPQFLSKDEVIRFYTQASVFICPSVYEPFGIINLEAMACGTPVVASAVGGIVEVVVPEETGLLIPFEPVDAQNFEPRDPDRFSRDMASAVNRLLASPEQRQRMGASARRRVEELFSWKSIAGQTLAFYEKLIAGGTL